MSTSKIKRSPPASKPRRPARSKPHRPVRSKSTALLAPARVETEDDFEKIALPDGTGVLLRAMPAEKVAQRSAERMADDDREQLTLATLLAERLAERLLDDYGADFFAELVAEQMSEKEREELRLAEERNFAQACQKRKALGMLDDGEKARLWEEIRSRHDEEASSAWLQLFKRDVPRYWHGLAPSLRRKLLEVPSVRRLLFGDGLPRERERPYKHARMLLTDVILFFGAELRQSGAGMASAEQAKWAATVVVLFYPTLARRMSEPDRIEHIRGAITSTATSAKKKPWKLIIATWNEIERGIERGGHARWRIDYAEYTKGAPNRT